MAGDQRAVLFADLAGFTALTEAHGDARAVDAAERFAELARASLPDAARVVKTIGDAVFIVAVDARTGLEAALAILRGVGEEDHFPGVRAGLHFGSVVERMGDVFGATVNVAARLTERAQIGQLVATAPIVGAAVDEDRVTVHSLGPVRLKNVAEAIEVFAIDDVDHEPDAQVLDPVCRMFVDADEATARLPWEGRTWMFCSWECASKFMRAPARYGAP
jgi:class 3 adenylate cyclase